MKLARFDGGRIGVVVDDKVYDVSAACGVDPGEWPPVGMVRFDGHRAAPLFPGVTHDLSGASRRVDVHFFP